MRIAAILFSVLILATILGCGEEETNDKSSNQMLPLYKQLEQEFEDPQAEIIVREYNTDGNVPASGALVNFEVDENVVGIHVAASLENYFPVVATSVYPPSRNGFVAGGTPSHPTIDKIPNAIIPYVLTFYLPFNGTDYPIEPGEWEMLIMPWQAEGFYYVNEVPGKIVVIEKRVQQNPLKYGTIDINFFFVWKERLTAESAQNNRVFNTMLIRLRNIFAQAGIKIGKFRFFDAPDAEALKYQSLSLNFEPNSDLTEFHELLTKSAEWLPEEDTEAHKAFNVFLVEEITGYVVPLGIAGSIPAPASIDGTPVSGVAVALGLLQYIEEQMGKVVAHELGHLLGLFHPTEATGQEFDPLDDTPKCEQDKYDINGDGIVSEYECRNVDADNLMFWSVNIDNYHGKITEEQKTVMLHSPWVH